MELIPSIDIRGGRSVRLYRGNFAEETVYGNPVTQAREFAAKGAARLHVVDLDAARSGVATNGSLITEILSESTVPVEVGGGIRTRERAEELLAEGADRVVLGSVALESPELVIALAEAYPERIVVGLDHKTEVTGGVVRRVVVVHGWQVASALELLEALALFDGVALAAIVSTDVGRDSTLSGGDLEGYAVLLGACAHPVIASGGVGSLEDLAALGALEVGGRALAGAIVGKAFQSGAIAFEEAVALCAR